ncbi:hypothetical protein NDR87_32095 [Nocardia sp. CDC159]|uniref:Uncharacterized protein n=1 Tax=Nocardia pulmonis TaxID=2951408 RepID=A0A9X2J0S8_9NOCA|nr:MULTISPECIES: hypothetical protein [Nocardia]MCM6778134.1 hypothetical protein [Nocardia pulmonis]MCM6791023.1 hypothetical protein [Nocardia sp. CDC159]
MAWRTKLLVFDGGVLELMADEDDTDDGNLGVWLELYRPHRGTVTRADDETGREAI